MATTSVAIVACARGNAGPPVGVSDRHERAPGFTGAGGQDAGFVDGAAALPANYRTTFTKINKARFVSQGHASGRWEVDVWANEAAQKALAARTRQVTPGAVVVEEHYERSTNPAPASSGASDKPRGPIMVMEKREAGFAKDHGDWRWAVVGAQGQLVKDGVIESCAGCHDDAPMDGLFPIVETP
jgi:hypothetical protein